MSASSVTHPIDLLKVRMLLFGEQAKNQSAKLTLVREIVAREGMLGLYSGLSAALLRQALFSTTRFGLYDLVKKGLGETPSRPLPYSRKVIATSAAGSTAALVACPADVMLVRMQADGRLPPAQRRNYGNVLRGMVMAARAEGISALYRGVGPLAVRGVAVTTAQFSTYDEAKEQLRARVGMADGLPLHFCASLAAGVVAAIVSTPLDVVKSRMMNATRHGQHGAEHIVYRSSLHCTALTLRNEGIRGLYKGLIPCYMRMGPQVMLMWVFVEQYRRLWNKVVPATAVP